LGQRPSQGAKTADPLQQGASSKNASTASEE
jgi:hypothetical protein